MQPDTILRLGNFVFRDTEVPEHMPFGGEQKLAVHELVGGVRVVQALGRIERDIEWAGLIRGADATDRALYLDNMRVQGKAIGLSWGKLSYNVVIEDFDPTYERFYQVPYRIKCKVIANQTAPVSQADNTNIDDQISNDMTTASGLAAQIGDPTLNSLFTTFQTAVGAVTSFANATSSVIAGVMQPLAAVQTQVGILTAAVSATIASAASIGVAGAIPLAMAASLTGAIAATEQMAMLNALTGTLGRISGNLGSVYGSQATVAVAGGDLFVLAAGAYGQAQEWTTIAAANGLVDPVIQGLQNLTVPQSPDGSDGVLNS
jgi:hypothetical protein